ncbi:hypothetical protein C8Q74DRAFT_1290204 [Fomes fomentarius]|nr:hypothetical protein C8Q74DRAFT_1290204 [Fomes fomentarius]
MRPIISYDDIATQPAPNHETKPPPQPLNKRRKTTQSQRQGGGRSHPQHWDDPGNQGQQVHYDDTGSVASSSNAHAGMGVEPAGANEEYHEEEEEESRELTYEEIWDDSALIHAWNSAAAEYEAYHGPGKKWKEEPVEKSPLWYNVPPAITSKGKSKQNADDVVAKGGTSAAHVEEVALHGGDSTPLNFDTFVPSHDASLAAAAAGPLLTVPAMDGVSSTGTVAEAAAVSQDEAFSRAMTAMYWSGYWTAVYHCRRNESANVGSAEVTDHTVENAEDDGEEMAEDDEEMLPAQR